VHVTKIQDDNVEKRRSEGLSVAKDLLLEGIGRGSRKLYLQEMENNHEEYLSYALQTLLCLLLPLLS
jgi:hypothetical protein